MSTAAHTLRAAHTTTPPSGRRSHRREARAAHPGPGVTGAATAVKIATCIVAPLVCMLGVLGGIGSFATVRHLATPWFGPSAWIVPVGVDVGILALLAWDLLTEYLGVSWPVLRWTAWAFITATTYLNIAAAHGDPTASVMHAAMPVLFVTVVEGIRHLIRQCTGLAAGTRIERIPIARWLLAPHTTFLLARRMVLWHVTSYQDGLRLEYQRLLAVSCLQQTYGRRRWRWRAPLQDRLALRLPPAGSATRVDTTAPASLPDLNTTLLNLLPQQCMLQPPKPASPMTEHDRELVTAAARILKDARSQGQHLSQAALARQLRARGHAVSNQRLRWLASAAGSG